MQSTDLNELTIKSQWEQFSALFIAPDAPPLQRSEMRRAFYAGTVTMMKINLELDNLTEDQAVDVLENIYDESEEFAQAIQAGKA